MPGEEYSIIEFFGSDDAGHKCGYCKGSSGSLSDSMWAHSLMVQDYQDLIDRGWRRSGLYCYKPKMDSTCCPLYTIRCNALEIQLSKSQKKVIKKFNKFLAEGSHKKSTEEDQLPSKSDEAEGSEQHFPNPLPDLPEKNKAALSTAEDSKVNLIDSSVKSKGKDRKPNKTRVESSVTTTQGGSSKSNVPSASSTASVASDEGKVSNVPCKKAKLMRQERWLEKLKKKGIDPSQVSPKKQIPAKTLEEFLEMPKNPKHRLELRLVQSCPPSNEFLQTKTESFLVYRKYQNIIHNDELSSLTERQYTKFLVNSPLEPSEDTGMKLCSYHHQYWLDGKLIAVGVIDLLPSCVSSVYLYYDPDFSFLSLGTYAALREIALTRELQSTVPTLQYYYMGFYIHSCPKMRYKGQFNPSFLLSPTAYSWHPLERCRPLLEVAKYQTFISPEEQQQQDVDLNEVLVLYQHTAMSFGLYCQRMRTRGRPVGREETGEVGHYARLVGPACAARMLLYRSNRR